MTNHISIETTVAPSQLPVTLDQARRFIRDDESEDMDLFLMMLGAATVQAEKFLNTSLLEKTIKMTVYRAHPNNHQYNRSWNYPAYQSLITWNQFWMNQTLELLYAPITAVNSVAIGTWLDGDTTLTPSSEGVLNDYSVDLEAQPGRIKFHTLLNISPLHVDHVTVNYTAGYTTPAIISPDITNAILIMAMRLWENRGEEDFVNPLSGVVRSILSMHRKFYFS